tara:strand:- start:437 stop:664 length:228 start_codon:yes stop_codon:yes gene_type:complete
MFEDLIKDNNALSEINSKLKSDIEKLEKKNNMLLEFAKGVSYNSPLQFEKLEDELRRLDERDERFDTGEEGEGEG